MDVTMTEIKNGNDTATIRRIYKIGLLLLAPLLLAFILMHTELAKNILLRSGKQCSIYKATGLPCPGCGGTRASFALAYFHILESIKLNAAVFTGTLFYIIFIVTETLHLKLGIKGFSERGFFVMFYLWLAVTMIHWIYKITVLFI